MVQGQVADTPKKDQAFIKQDPRLAVSRNARNFSFWMIGLWVILLITTILLRRNFHIDVYDFLYGINLILAMAIGNLITQIYNIPRYKKMERQRQAVAQGTIQVLADQQPLSNASTHSLPLILSYKYLNLALFLLWFVLGFVILTFGATLWLGLSYSLMFFEIICGVFLVVLAILRSRYKRAELIADENGLTLKSAPANKVQYIPWHEARLFAIDTFVGEEKRKVQIPRFFELSSEQEVIRWPGVSKKASDSVLNIQRVLSEEEYTKQLENLHASIVEKTSLPLNDLRKQA